MEKILFPEKILIIPNYRDGRMSDGITLSKNISLAFLLQKNFQLGNAFTAAGTPVDVRVRYPKESAIAVIETRGQGRLDQWTAREINSNGMLVIGELGGLLESLDIITAPTLEPERIDIYDLVNSGGRLDSSASLN